MSYDYTHNWKCSRIGLWKKTLLFMFCPSKPLKKEKLFLLHPSLHNPLLNCLQLLWLKILKEIRNVKSCRCNHLEIWKLQLPQDFLNDGSYIPIPVARKVHDQGHQNIYLRFVCLSIRVVQFCHSAWRLSESRWGTTGFNSILARLSDSGYTPSDRTNVRFLQDHSSSPRSR